MPLASSTTLCWEKLVKGCYIQIICLSVINALLAITAIVGNTVILIALHKETSIHQPSKALIRNVATTNLCVGFIEVLFVAYWISILQGRWQTCHVLFYAHAFGATISLFVSVWAWTAISVDRLLALLLGLRYRQIVTLRRVYLVVIVVWVCPGIGNAVIFFSNLDGWIITSGTFGIVCVITSAFCYCTIFFKLRHQQARVHNHSQEQLNQATPLDISRYRKTVFSALWLQMASAFCYLPYFLVSPVAYREVVNNKSPTFYLVLYTTITVMCFSSTLNPFLYCWHNKSIRRTVWGILFGSEVWRNFPSLSF